jgi:hypothetical protein
MLKKLALVVVVILAMAVFLVARDWDSPELGQALLDKAGEATGIEMTATGFQLNLLKGVRLEGVKARSEKPGRTFFFSMDQMVFEHRLAPLLSGTVAIERIVLNKPQFELVESAEATPSESEPDKEEAPPPTEDSDVPEQGGLALDVKEIVLTDAALVMRSQKGGAESTTKVEGLNVRFQNLSYLPDADPPLHAFGADGGFDIRQVSLDRLAIRETQGQLSFAEGRFELKPLQFVMDEGRFSAEMAIDFNPTPFTYTLSAQGNPLDFNAMVDASAGFGPGNLQIDAEGMGTDSKEVKGTGRISLAEGEFPSIPVLSQIDEKLGKKLLVGSPYKETELRFRLSNNVVTLEPFPFETEWTMLELDGTVNLEGPLGLDLALGTVREGISIEGVGETVLDVLTNDKGWVMIPMTIQGTKDNPKVRPDSKALLAQAGEGTKRLATEAATDAILGLFKKKKKQ